VDEFSAVNEKAKVGIVLSSSLH